MGMYTGVAVRCRLNVIGAAIFGDKIQHDLSWQEIRDMYPDVPALQDYARHERANMIPHCCSAYFKSDDFAAIGFEVEPSDPDFGHLIKQDGDNLEFACSLKNYGGEVEGFAKLLPYLVAEPCVLFSRYEKCDEWEQMVINPAS
jgi:hypothetical protein